MTNDIGQLEQSIHSHYLHIYELYRSKGYSERAAKQESIKSMVREMWRISDPNLVDTPIILRPVLSAVLFILSKEAHGEGSPEWKAMIRDTFAVVEKIYNQEVGNKNG